jgi:hypothetical protein
MGKHFSRGESSTREEVFITDKCFCGLCGKLRENFEDLSRFQVFSKGFAKFHWKEIVSCVWFSQMLTKFWNILWNFMRIADSWEVLQKVIRIASNSPKFFKSSKQAIRLINSWRSRHWPIWFLVRIYNISHRKSINSPKTHVTSLEKGKN